MAAYAIPRYCESSVSILIVDNNPDDLEMLSNALAQPGLEILTTTNPKDGLGFFRDRRPKIVVTALVMEHMNGIELLDRIMEIDAATDVILMTKYYSAESAVEAIKKGAIDYLNKPVSLGALNERIGKALEKANERKHFPQLENELGTHSEFEGIVGRSPGMLEMFSRIRRVAPHYRTALIVGETGTGKDLVARALHRLSPVASGQFVAVNCSAVVETLFESELFGHVQGSFTGAIRDKPGFFEHAHRGTLFLDEIGDLPLGMQAKLLRVLQDQEVQRVGGLNPHKVEVHVVAATNHDLRAEIAQKRFREDLYYRLSMVEIRTPPLAERREDLPLLERYLVARFAAQYGKHIRGLTHRAQMVLCHHSWPGNVRELENVVGHAAMMTISDIIDVEDLPPHLHALSGYGENMQRPILERPADGLAGQERLLILQALETAGGNQTQAAHLLRISRDRLRYKVKKHNLRVRNPANPP